MRFKSWPMRMKPQKRVSCNFQGRKTVESEMGLTAVSRLREQTDAARRM